MLDNGTGSARVLELTFFELNGVKPTLALLIYGKKWKCVHFNVFGYVVFVVVFVVCWCQYLIGVVVNSADFLSSIISVSGTPWMSGSPWGTKESFGFLQSLNFHGLGGGDSMESRNFLDDPTGYPLLWAPLGCWVGGEHGILRNISSHGEYQFISVGATKPYGFFIFLKPR